MSPKKFTLERLFSIDKPIALPIGKWEEWYTKTKEDHPIYYFLSETVPDAYHWVMTPVRCLQEKITFLRRKHIHKTHLLPSTLPPGNYYGWNERLINSMMTSIVDYVEVEKAHMSVWTGTHTVSFSEKYFRIGLYRNAYAGLQYLRWEASLDGENWHQAKVAREVLFLYNWWTRIRPQRKDPFERAEWDKHYAKFPNFDAPEQGRKIIEEVTRIETMYNNEDIEMMIRLAKIIPSL